jgi:hypothetical protein
MTRYEAFIQRDWQDGGIANLIVARIQESGRTSIGFFLLDIWCLGVKDAFLIDDTVEAGFRELLSERLPEDFRERIHPACAKKLIEGAHDYAEALGFAPARDYRKARRVLTGINAAGCPETFTYGREGRPFYFQGPHDDPERTERVITVLSTRLGPDGFGFQPYSEADEDAAFDEAGEFFECRENLLDFFADRGGLDLNFYTFSGLIAALQVCPQLIKPLSLIDLITGPDHPDWENRQEFQAFLDDVMTYWNYFADTYGSLLETDFDEEVDYPIDVVASDFIAVPDDELHALFSESVTDWCRGFLRATRQWPEAWGNALERPDLAPHWARLHACADPANTEILRVEPATSLTPPAVSTALNLAIVALIRALRPQPPRS